MIDDVDAAFTRLQRKAQVAREPKLLPWENRSVQVRGPGRLLSRDAAGDEMSNRVLVICRAGFCRAAKPLRNQGYHESRARFVRHKAAMDTA
ncbi:hypothetical protein [Sphingomonas sp.]|uniref:hypothetical protein n=1 Tax=Sphingomonas sp. TaxID=28214 RepID=UPI003AFFE72A